MLRPPWFRCHSLVRRDTVVAEGTHSGTILNVVLGFLLSQYHKPPRTVGGGVWHDQRLRNTVESRSFCV